MIRLCIRACSEVTAFAGTLPTSLFGLPVYWRCTMDCVLSCAYAVGKGLQRDSVPDHFNAARLAEVHGQEEVLVRQAKKPRASELTTWPVEANRMHLSSCLPASRDVGLAQRLRQRRRVRTLRPALRRALQLWKMCC